MKITLVALIVCFNAIGGYIEQALASQPARGNLVVTITGIENNHGTIKIGLYNKQAGFLEISHVVYGINKPATKGQISVTFKDLPSGLYAVSVIHDENNNGRMDTNLLGMPKEGYAFSRNVRPRFSAPTFSATAIQLDGKTNIIQIKMRY